jgi:serine/threonine-protein kinase RsbW
MAEPEPAPSTAETITYHDAVQLPTVRAFARRHAIAAGLPPERADLLILAVSELVTNTLQHTAGAGQVVIWAADGQLTCDVIDSGPMRSFGRTMPPAHAAGGRGLAIVERICDGVSTHASPAGTVTRLRFDL